MNDEALRIRLITVFRSLEKLFEQVSETRVTTHAIYLSLSEASPTLAVQIDARMQTLMTERNLAIADSLAVIRGVVESLTERLPSEWVFSSVILLGY